MTDSKKTRVVARAISLLDGSPEGLRYAQLKSILNREFVDINSRTIDSYIVNLEPITKGTVYKADYGLFKHAKFQELEHDELAKSDATKDIKTYREEEFYRPFADWLVHDLEECTKSTVLGGNKFKDKWGTPDVIGIREPRRSAIVQLPTEIVSAEIKIDTTALITAYGQSCAYKLFSHKSYLVVPKQSHSSDINRLDGLCRISGIGLILFEVTDPKNARFEIRVRAVKHEPDMYYVEKYMRLIEDDLF